MIGSKVAVDHVALLRQVCQLRSGVHADGPGATREGGPRQVLQGVQRVVLTIDILGKLLKNSKKEKSKKKDI